MKRKLAKLASRVERGVDHLLRRRVGVAQVIDPYTGYATPEHLVVRGRVLSKTTQSNADARQGRWTNLVQMLRLFMTDEVADVVVQHDTYRAISDEEGYFTLLIPRGDAAGRVEITVSANGVSAICPVFVSDPSASFGIISDIDDTMMETGAYSLWRNIWTSLTGNALTRRVFPDAVTLMEVLQQSGRNPVYFVSSSPWNLHGFLNKVFARNGLPDGPMFLRDYGISETQFITGTHGDHKGSAIDVILAANPDLPFMLVGDTGQHDAHVYSDAVLRHEGRITHVILRAPGKGLDRQDRQYIDALAQAGITTFVGATYSDAIAALRPSG